MIGLERHIEVLLLDHDCVIVPDLGGFMAHHLEARYDEDEGLFLPPLRTIGFNTQLKLNDSLLVHSYIETYDLSYPEALRRIEEEVRELKQIIDNDGSYYLNSIGTLSMNTDGIYTFEPCEAGLLTPCLYALSSFEMTKLSDIHKSAAVSAETQLAETVVRKDVDATHTVDEEDDDEGRVVKIKLSWIRNAVAVAAVVLAFFVATPYISNLHIGSSDNKVADVTKSDMGSEYIRSIVESVAVSTEPSDAEIASVVADESSAVANESSVDESSVVADGSGTVSEPSVSNPEPVAPETSSVAEELNEDTYCLVLASKISRKNAKAFVDKLHKNGFSEATIYVNDKNIVRVVYGAYETETDAYNAKRQLADNKDFEQAWVLKK